MLRHRLREAQPVEQTDDAFRPAAIIFSHTHLLVPEQFFPTRPGRVHALDGTNRWRGAEELDSVCAVWAFWHFRGLILPIDRALSLARHRRRSAALVASVKSRRRRGGGPRGEPGRVDACTPRLW